MAILLAQFLEEAAEIYRKYGNIPVYIETAENIEGVVKLDPDLFNVRKRNVALILETSSLHDKRPQLSPKPQAVPPGDESKTQDLPVVIPTQRNPEERKVVPPSPTQPTERGRHRRPKQSNPHRTQTA